MRIGFDAKRLFLNYTGLGNYSRGIVSNLQYFFPENEYHLYTTKAIRNKDTEQFFNSSKFIIHESKSFFKSFWRSYSIVKELQRDRIDVYHGLSSEIPIGINKTGIKTVVTIHDLIFRFFKKDYGLIDKVIYDFKTKYACNNSDKIISISEFTKKDIINIYRVDSRKINVIYLSVDEIFKNKWTSDDLLHVKNKFNLPEKYFLYVGSVIGRKNLKVLIHAMTKINKKELIPLVVVGKGSKYLEESKKLVRKYGLNKKVSFLSDVANHELPAIYQLSEFFVFPSVYEGFGLPVLEALYSGKPVIISDETSMVEVAGNCGVKLPAKDIGRWAETILDMINKKYIPGIEMNCDQYLKKFNPEYISKLLMDEYRDILN